MIEFSVLPGVDINVFLLIFIGLGAGILSGFAGIGGAFVVTSALVVLGFPASFAVGTSLVWVVGNSIMAALGHGKLGNVDVKLGIILLFASVGGVEVGVRVLNWVKDRGVADEAVLSIAICALLIVGSYTVIESFRRKRQLDRMHNNGEESPLTVRRLSVAHKLQYLNIPPMIHFKKSGITMSFWLILTIGFLIGILAGIMGVGGGFIMVPTLVYVFGLQSFVAVGTSLFQIVFTAGYGSIRHTMSGNVVIFAAFIMVIASSIGVQYGVLVTRYVHGVSVRIILGVSILLIALGTILKLLDVLLGEAAAWLGAASTGVTFASLGLIVAMIVGLFIAAIRYRRGQSIPAWMVSLVSGKAQ